MSQIENGLILRIRMGMVSITERMRMYNDYSILHMGMGKAIDSAPINGEEDKQ